MKTYESTSYFDFPWFQVIQAFWKRYPNPYSKHVLSEDILERKISNGKIYTKKLLIKTNRVPSWAERLIKIKKMPIIEESILDLSSKIITTYTWNTSHHKLMKIVEKVKYFEDKQNLSQTVVHRRATISSSLHGIRFAVEKFGYERFKCNCEKSVKGFIFVLHQMFGKTSAHNADHILDGTLKETAIEKAIRAKELAKAKTNIFQTFNGKIV